ncbi:hypothetical protein BGZ81_001344 [Podila clonocystis]|nr:hypothetical protein BGZ81_001344 [Podila clonocystis]
MDIPEIVYRIGWFVKVTKPHRSNGRDSFHPADLIALTKVNRLFHITLTPLLWMMYDKDWSVPFETVQAQSHHFRYLTLESFHYYAILKHLWPANGLHSTHLRELHSDYKMLSANTNLLYSNPQLSVLILKNWDDDIEEELDRIQQALESLTRLKALRLDTLPSYFAQRLTTFLNNNAASLTSLIIKYPRFQPVFDGCHSLEYLTNVEFDIESDYGRGLPQLFRLCPSLTKLKLVHWEFCPVAELSKTMREFCPKLESINYRDLHCYDTPLPQCNSETMLQASDRWLDVISYVIFVSDEICKTLISHAGWLETLKLFYSRYNKDREQYDRNVCKILAHCSHLRTVIVSGGEAYEPPNGTRDKRNTCLEWFEEEGPWACSNLEVLVFQGFETGVYEMTEIGNFDDLWEKRTPFHNSSKDKAFLEAIASQGWRYEPLRKLIEKALRLRHMKYVQVEFFEYVRKDMMSRQEREQILDLY